MLLLLWAVPRVGRTSLNLPGTLLCRPLRSAPLVVELLGGAVPVPLVVAAAFFVVLVVAVELLGAAVVVELVVVVLPLVVVVTLLLVVVGSVVFGETAVDIDVVALFAVVVLNVVLVDGVDELRVVDAEVVFCGWVAVELLLLLLLVVPAVVADVVVAFVVVAVVALLVVLVMVLLPLTGGTIGGVLLVEANVDEVVLVDAGVVIEVVLQH